jgi:hypothetical protein
MLRNFVLLLTIVTLAACVSNPLPDGYAGPTATIRDTAVPQGTTRAMFFYVSEIDGQQVRNALHETRGRNQGRGNFITPIPYERKVPVRKVVLKLEARSAHGAPIAEILNSANMYSAEDAIALDVKPNAVYVVKGELTHGSRKVWLEDASTGEQVGARAREHEQK